MHGRGRETLRLHYTQVSKQRPSPEENRRGAKSWSIWVLLIVPRLVRAAGSEGADSQRAEREVSAVHLRSIYPCKHEGFVC